MHFRILKMIATIGFHAALECIKFVFGPVSAPDPAGELTALPQNPLADIMGTLLLKVRGEDGKERTWMAEGSAP